jgi:hypothetical protein
MISKWILNKKDRNLWTGFFFVQDRNTWRAVVCTFVYSFLFMSIVTVELGCHLAQHIATEVCLFLIHGNEILWHLILTVLDLTQEDLGYPVTAQSPIFLAYVLQTATIFLRRHNHGIEREVCPCLLLCDFLYSDWNKPIFSRYQHAQSADRLTLDLAARIYFETLLHLCQSTQRYIPEHFEQRCCVCVAHDILGISLCWRAMQHRNVSEEFQPASSLWK